MGKRQQKTHRRLLLFVNAMAASLLFFSWFGQNFFLANADAKVEEIERAIATVNNLMANELQVIWQFQNATRSSPIDHTMVINSAAHYATTVRGAMTTTLRIDKKNRAFASHLVMFLQFQDNIRECISAIYENSDGPDEAIQELINATNELMEWTPAIRQEASKVTYEIYTSASDNRDMWRNVFLRSFIAASILFVISWWFSKGNSILGGD